ncbi:MAG: DUF817 domain-containing protein [Minisyncoccia bacterium]
MCLVLYLARFFEKCDTLLFEWAGNARFKIAVYEFLRFGAKQAWACLFGALMLCLIMATYVYYPAGSILARYDFLVAGAVLIQVLMLRYKLETWSEARVIFIFHIVGTAMEVWKTAMGSWIYPEVSFLRIGGVPLFTGFMYAAVGSYIARCWRLFDFQFTFHPTSRELILVSLAIYINFFSHHYVYDIRYFLLLCIAILFARTRIYFRVAQVHRSMPLLLGFTLVSFFIWLAENIGTFTAVWVYPNQSEGWQLVSIEKLGSWFLLMIISYTLVYINTTAVKPGEVSFAN